MGHYRRGLFDFFGDDEHDEHHGGYGHHSHHDSYHHDYQGHYDPAYDPRPPYADEEVVANPDTSPRLAEDNAIAALRERFARGEIDRTEYEERLAVLEGRPAL